MELWIRSQDRENLIFIKGKLELYKGKFIQTSISPYMTEQHYGILYKDNRLGEYKSKERAIEVLDDIGEILSGKKVLEFLNKTKGNMDNVYPILFYEMPKE